MQKRMEKVFDSILSLPCSLREIGDFDRRCNYSKRPLDSGFFSSRDYLVLGDTKKEKKNPYPPHIIIRGRYWNSLLRHDALSKHLSIPGDDRNRWKIRFLEIP